MVQPELETPTSRARTATAGRGLSPLLQRVALHTIVEEVDDRIITAKGEVFNTSAYSQFKYGHRQQAERYADELTGVILGSPLAPLLSGKEKPLVVSASAYKRLRTAAQSVADGVLLRLRWAGFDADAGRIHRAKLTEGDYGTMNAAERAFWMANNGLSLDEKLFYGRHVIIVDDVRITGSHERAIERLFQTVHVASVTSAYVVEIDPALVARDTRIEDRMNHACIKTLHDLYMLMWEEERYVLTARTVKFVLSRPLDALEVFLEKIDDNELRALHVGLLDDGYYAMAAYAEGTDLLIREVGRRMAAAIGKANRGQVLDHTDRTWIKWDPARTLRPAATSGLLSIAPFTPPPMGSTPGRI